MRSTHSPLNSLKLGLSNVMGAIALKRRRQEKARKKGSAPVEWSQTSWGQRLIKSATLVIALLCTASITLADIKITTKSSTGGQSITSTTYFKGARQRTEGMGYTSIYQCDLKRVIQINDKTKTYLIAPFASQEGAKGAARQTPAAGTRRGGVITYTTSSVDTGERKEILGMTAKRIKSKTVVAASEGACSSMNMEMETDGWYVDLPAGLSCPTDGSAQPSFVEQSDCVDEVRFKTEGVARTGYPVMTTTSIKFNTPGVSIPTSTSTQEVVDVSRAAVDSSLFEIPAGYTEVKSMQELGSPY